MKRKLNKINRYLHSATHLIKQFNTVCELGKMYKIESLRPLVEKKLRKIAENKEIDIYARQRAKLILNPITLPETRKDVKTEHTLEQGNCET